VETGCIWLRAPPRIPAFGEIPRRVANGPELAAACAENLTRVDDVTESPKLGNDRASVFRPGLAVPRATVVSIVEAQLKDWHSLRAPL
jgi:hypothetical protein